MYDLLNANVRLQKNEYDCTIDIRDITCQFFSTQRVVFHLK